ncbi:MAG: hypothetical protein V1836_01605 [Candidatus Aenigmatarchaeota archaeon]
MDIMTGQLSEAYGIKAYQTLDQDYIERMGLVNEGWTFGGSDMYRKGRTMFMISPVYNAALLVPKNQRKFYVQMIYDSTKKQAE